MSTIALTPDEPLLNYRSRVTARRRPPMDSEIVVDSFAGFGGWGLGEEVANGWAVDVAINHSPLAIAAHKVNHPATLHYEASVFEVDPRKVEPGRRIGHCHFSPDCTHHSKARGGAPVSDRVRGLAWIVLAWAYQRRPRVITLENVEEFQGWGPTIDRGDGQRVPDPARKGETFRAFIGALTTGIPDGMDNPAIKEIRETLGNWCPIHTLVQGLGYKAEHREMIACDYGAPTRRKRFFMVARCDGRPIRWPKPTYGPSARPYRTAADCIDWSLPCPSIFMTREQVREYYDQTGIRVIRPLKPATLRRIAAGVMRYVVEATRPFIVQCNHSGGMRVRSVDEPMCTLTSARDAHGLVVPSLVSVQNASSAGIHDAARPMPTITAWPKGGGHALVAAFLNRYNGSKSMGDVRCQEMARPIGTLDTSNRYGLTAAHLVHLRGTARDGQRLDAPGPTLTSGGLHVGLVAAFLQTYYGNSRDGHAIDQPAPTLVTKDRIGLVTVILDGETYVIADIGMRMLHPHELLKMQFGEHARGWVLMGTKSEQVAGIGNSVCPHVSKAIVKANVKLQRVDSEAAA